MYCGKCGGSLDGDEAFCAACGAAVRRPSFDSLGQQEQLPQASTILVLGILSIVFSGLLGVGLVLGIVALVLASRSMQTFGANSARYLPSTVSSVRAGKVCAIVGTCISGLYLLYALVALVFLGGWLAVFPWDALL